MLGACVPECKYPRMPQEDIRDGVSSGCLLLVGVENRTLILCKSSTLS